MSHDLVIFDPSSLADFPSGAAAIVQAVEAYATQAEQDAAASTVAPSAKVAALISMMQQKYGDFYSEESPWTMWPPGVSANGRYCVINLSFGSDITNITISATNTVQRLGLILIDPQGRTPLLSAPSGDGLLD